MNYLAYAFFVDFWNEPLHGDIKHLIESRLSFSPSPVPPCASRHSPSGSAVVLGFRELVDVGAGLF
jgi:hypothetical protein